MSSTQTPPAPPSYLPPPAPPSYTPPPAPPSYPPPLPPRESWAKRHLGLLGVIIGLLVAGLVAGIIGIAVSGGSKTATTNPTAPATQPTAPATQPTAPATQPTAPATQPTAPVVTAVSVLRGDGYTFPVMSRAEVVTRLSANARPYVVDAGAAMNSALGAELVVIFTPRGAAVMRSGLADFRSSLEPGDTASMSGNILRVTMPPSTD